MKMLLRISAHIALVVVLAGCATPFADRVAYDTSIRNASGTITLSDPKLYTREALISERARDLKWINRLITDSEDSTKVIFKPELVREVEQITAMSAAIGLKFDPAAALAYRHDKETSNIQHEMDIMKMQLQLDQLKRDAELVRTEFESQAVPVNEGISKLGDASAQDGMAIPASAVDQLKAAIDKLSTALTSRLDTDGKQAAATSVTSSPFDDFRDRRAYRDMLKAAQNAAELDQLHDYANARLIRLNFQASVIPDSDNLQSIGAIKIHVVAPTPEGAATQRFLRHWLEYINTDSKFRSNTDLNMQASTITELLLSGSFEKVDVFGIEVLLPIVIDGNNQPQSPTKVFHRSGWELAGKAEQKNYQDALTVLSSLKTQETADILGSICGNGKPTTESDLIDRRMQEAEDRELSIGYIQLADNIARAAGRSTILTNDITSKLSNGLDFRGQVLALMSKDSRCNVYVERFTAQPRWKALSEVLIAGNNNVRVYEIGPREQVQQVSTVARSASSLALAASIAASAPAAGVGTEAAANYSRQAMGRATALERVPSVVGYSQAGDGSFGWVLGPHAVLNARGNIDMAQLLKTYDLSVDMSVPGWWPAFNLEIATAWAPAPTLIASGKFPTDTDNRNRVTVPLVHNSAVEFDSLTQYMLGLQDRSVEIENVEGGPINACDKSTLLITGKNIWKARQAFVLGQGLGEDTITVTADMKGILLSVPAITPLINGNFSKSLYVITPLGMSRPKDVEYVPEPSGESCKPRKAQTEEPVKDAVSVTEVKPLEFVVPSTVHIEVTGSNLGKVVRVTLGGQPGNAKAESDGKSMTVDFDDTQTSSVRASDNTELAFFEKDKNDRISVTVTKFVRTQARR